MSGATTPPSSGQAGPDFITGPDGTVYRAVTPQSAAIGGAQNVSGERHVSAVAGNSTFNRKKGATILLCAVGAAVAFIVLRPHHQPKDPNQLPADAMQVHEIARFEPPPLPRASPAAFSVPAPPPAAPPPLPTQQTNFQNPLAQKPVDPLEKARHASLFVYTSGSSPAVAQGDPAGSGGPVVPGAAGPNSLAAHLQATPLTGVTASVLQHQPYLLTQGTLIPCVLQTAMDSTLPGFTTCLVPQDVIGKTGITLLDRGTKLFGEFQGGIRQGQNRLFVLWTRAETPNGVIINLDSPGTDPLGRSGFDGAIDNHFWERFGGALLLTLVQGGLQAGTAALSPNGSTYVSTGNVDSVAGTALNNSINIPPTLRKNQGEMVSIMVARDLDFCTVYQVSATAGAPLALTGARQ